MQSHTIVFLSHVLPQTSLTAGRIRSCCRDTCIHKHETDRIRNLHMFRSSCLRPHSQSTEMVLVSLISSLVLRSCSLRHRMVHLCIGRYHSFAERQGESHLKVAIQSFPLSSSSHTLKKSLGITTSPDSMNFVSSMNLSRSLFVAKCQTALKGTCLTSLCNFRFPTVEAVVPFIEVSTSLICEHFMSYCKVEEFYLIVFYAL